MHTLFSSPLFLSHMEVSSQSNGTGSHFVTMRGARFKMKLIITRKKEINGFWFILLDHWRHTDDTLLTDCVNIGAKKLEFLSLGTKNISTDTQDTS